MPTITKTFNYSGQLQIADLPAGTNSVTMHLWGGAGGCGGPDTSGDGADGGAGHYVTVANLDISAYAGAKKIAVGVGGGGEAGGMGQDTDGGRNGQALTGYSGGDGGSSGRGSGNSGSGGGGGGATTVTLFESGQDADTIKLAIAGGGGGGGGSGQSSRGGAGINTNSATGNTPGTLGENGANHSGDGGGDGAGGGGTDGGTGGSGATGDAGGFGGKAGSNTVPSGGSSNDGSGRTPSATDSAFYSTGIAVGGIAGTAGANGKAVLIFSIPSESKIKDAGAWKSFDGINYKVSGVWKAITEGYYKVSGVWKNIFTTDIEFKGNSIGFGNVSGGSTSGTEGSGGIPTPSSIPPPIGGGNQGDGFIAPPPGKANYKCRQHDHVINGDTGNPVGSEKSKGVVCTMMHDTAGFGLFRNVLWHKYWHEKGWNGKKSFTQDHRMEKGYHAVFIPLVRIAKKRGTFALIVRKIITHMGRRTTSDMYAEMRGKKRDTLGAIYMAVFTPICWGIGKFMKKRTSPQQLHQLRQPINNHKEKHK